MAKKTSKEQRRIDWVNDSESGRRWFDTLKKEKTGSVHTQIAFAKGLKLFCDYVGLTPDELIMQRKMEAKSDDEQTKRRAEENVRRFFIKLSENGLSRASARIYHSAVKSFYTANYYPLLAKTPSVMFEEKRPVGIEELRKIDGIADARERALVRFLKDSGMSRGDVAELRYKDIQREFEEGKDFIHLRVVRHKAQVRYDTFIGREAVEALRNYLETRRVSGEAVTPSSALFASVSKSRKPLTAKTLTILLMRIGERVGIKLSPHRIRKYFETRMALGKVHPVILKYWMGHKIKGGGDVEASYIIPSLEEQRALYAEAYDNITLAAKPGLEERLRKVEELREKIGPETLAELQRIGIQIARLKEEAPEAEANEGERQRVVEEGELENHLSHGWRFVAVLGNGKCVVSREE